MKTEVVWLRKGQMLDGTLVFVEEKEDGFVEVVVEVVKRYRMEHHVDSPEGQALKEKIKEDMIGKRVGVYNYGMGDDPVKVAVREEDDEEECGEIFSRGEVRKGIGISR